MVYNVLTENLTVEQIIGFIGKYAPVPKIEYVDTEIMNQLSYEVLNERFKMKGFEFKGSIERSVADTVELLQGVVGPHKRKVGKIVTESGRVL
jgi:hypothetical protein